MKKLIIFIALVLAPGLAWGETYYINPDCDYQGNGTTMYCATGVGQAGAYNVTAGVTFSGANSYLFKANSTVSAAFISITAGGNDADNRLIIGSFNPVSGLPTSDKAYLDGMGNGQSRVISTVGGLYHITIQDLDITFDDNTAKAHRIGIAIPSSGGDKTINYDNIIQRVKVHDIRNDDDGGIYYTNGIRAAGGGHLKILNSVVSGIDSDCFWGNGDYIEIGYSTFEYAGGGSAVNGDEIQIGDSDNARVHHCILRHSQIDEKQVILFAGDNFIVEDNFIYGYLGESPTLYRTVYASAGDGQIVRRNYIEGSSLTAVIYADKTAVNFTAENNVIKVYGASTWGAYPFVNNSKFIYNTFIYAGTESSTGCGILQGGSHTGGLFVNNIFVDFLNGICSTDLGDSYNDFFGATNACTDSAGTPRACGTGTITSDPLLDANGRPALNSPVINAGTDVGLPYWGFAPEIGAYEVGGYPIKVNNLPYTMPIWRMGVQ